MDPTDEIVEFARVVLEVPRLDRRLEHGFRALASNHPQVPIARICDFVALKCGEKERSERFSPGALLVFCHEDLANWWSVQTRAYGHLLARGYPVLSTLRKPPQSVWRLNERVSQLL
jgi:hypothetical protein